ncbi:MAG: ABC transporter permease [Bdellovibrionales bacterium]|nr:ABC transporter permease [Bdellovibrionales bacterium]
MRRISARLSALILTLACVFIVSRALVRWLPGDPLETLLSETGTSIPAETLRKELGLDLPFWRAATRDLGAFLRSGHLGISILSGEPVGPAVWERLRGTAVLSGLTLMIGLPLSLLVGLMAAGASSPTLRRLAGALCDLLGALGAALPTPWVGPLLMALLCVQFPVFPIHGHPLLPAITLSIGFIGLWSRLVRMRVAEVLRTGAAPGARARGMSETRVVLKYGLAPAGGALLAYLGTQTGALLTGSFITEAVFAWPGLGTIFVDAVLSRDYPVVEAAVFVGGALSLGGTMIGDWLRELVDPRGRDGA